jgi:pyridoxine kinase
MPLVMILSSYVAASRVGGGLGAFVLPAFAIDPVHVPTTLLGRHPGHGPPGGGAVPDALFRGMLDGVAAQNLLPLTDVILTGYFASADQVAAAAEFIDAARASPSQGISGRREVWVDPIIGDLPGGRYVSEPVALAVRDSLLPRADGLTPNLFELGWLTGRPVDSAGDAYEAAFALQRDLTRQPRLVVTSVSVPISGTTRIGALLLPSPQSQQPAMFSGVLARTGPLPRGTGDSFALSFLAHRLNQREGEDEAACLAAAVGTVDTLLARAQAWGAPELPIAACQGVIRHPPFAPLWGWKQIARQGE